MSSTNKSVYTAPYGQVQSERKLELGTLKDFQNFILASGKNPALPTIEVFTVNFRNVSANWCLTQVDYERFAQALSCMVRLRALRVNDPALHDWVISALCRHPAPYLEELRITFGPMSNTLPLTNPINLQAGQLRWVYLLESDLYVGHRFEYPSRYVEMVAALLAYSAKTIELLSIRGPLNVKQFFTRSTQSLNFPRLEVLKVWEDVIRESPCFAKVNWSIKALELWDASGKFLTGSDPASLRTLGSWFPSLVKLDLTIYDWKLPDQRGLESLGRNLIGGKRNIKQISLALEMAFGGIRTDLAPPLLKASQCLWSNAVNDWILACPALSDVTFQSGLRGLTRWTYDHGLKMAEQPEKRMCPDTDYALTAEGPGLYYETHETWVPQQA